MTWHAEESTLITGVISKTMYLQTCRLDVASLSLAVRNYAFLWSSATSPTPVEHSVLFTISRSLTCASNMSCCQEENINDRTLGCKMLSFTNEALAKYLSRAMMWEKCSLCSRLRMLQR